MHRFNLDVRTVRNRLYDAIGGQANPLKGWFEAGGRSRRISRIIEEVQASMLHMHEPTARLTSMSTPADVLKATLPADLWLKLPASWREGVQAKIVSTDVRVAAALVQWQDLEAWWTVNCERVAPTQAAVAAAHGHPEVTRAWDTQDVKLGALMHDAYAFRWDAFEAFDKIGKLIKRAEKAAAPPEAKAAAQLAIVTDAMAKILKGTTTGMNPKKATLAAAHIGYTGVTIDKYGRGSAAFRQAVASFLGVELPETRAAREAWEQENGFAEPAVDKEPTSYRTCGACWGAHAMNNIGLTHHGYQRPGWGHIIGDCFGVYKAPWEVSPELAEADLIKDLAKADELLKIVTGKLKYSKLIVQATREEVKAGLDKQPSRDGRTMKATGRVQIDRTDPRFPEAEKLAIENDRSTLRYLWRQGFGAIPWTRAAIRLWQPSATGPVGAPHLRSDDYVDSDFAGKPSAAILQG